MMQLPRLFAGEAGVDLQPDFRAWFRSDLGQHLLHAEEQLVGRILPDLFGYHALQVGQVVEANLLAGSRIRHRCVVDAQQPCVPGLSPLRAEPGQLPFAKDSLDLVFIHHGLDGAASPHALLREASLGALNEVYGSVTPEQLSAYERAGPAADDDARPMAAAAAAAGGASFEAAPDGLSDAGVTPTVLQRHLLAALVKVRPSVSQEDRLSYDALHRSITQSAKGGS